MQITPKTTSASRRPIYLLNWLISVRIRKAETSEVATDGIYRKRDGPIGIHLGFNKNGTIVKIDQTTHSTIGEPSFSPSQMPPAKAADPITISIVVGASPKPEGNQ